jgi:ankyrin repeat protein/WD40 repeat protein
MHAAHAAHHAMEQRKKREEKQRLQQEFFQAAAEGDSLKISSLLKEVDIEEKNSQNKTALVIAAEEGRVEVVKQLMTAGASFNNEDAEGNTPLLLACQNGHANVVAALIEQGASATKTNKKLISPLCVAALAGHENVVQYLIHKAKVDVNKSMNFKYSLPLEIAIEKKSAIAVEILIRNGANTSNSLHRIWSQAEESVLQALIRNGLNINGKNKEGNAPLHYALLKASSGYETSINILLKNGADPNAISDSDYTPLQIAASKGYIKASEILIQGGALVNKEDAKGVTALHIAAHKGQVDTMRLLVRHKAEIEKPNAEGSTPLLLAAFGGQTEAAYFLLEQGANPNSKNRNSIFPLLLAARGGDEEMVTFLLDKGADINEVNKKNANTALTAAIENKHEKVVALLLDRGANACDENHILSPLTVAAGVGHVGIIDRLIGAGADVNKYSRYFGSKNCALTPLFVASEKGHVDAVEYLLNKGADVNQGNKQLGITPIQIAAEKGHGNVLQVLLNSGANINKEIGVSLLCKAAENKDVKGVSVLLKSNIHPNHKNEDNISPLSLAVAKNGNETVIRMLIEAGAEVNETYPIQGLEFPLQIASSIGDEKNVQELIKHGANVNQVDSQGFSSLFTAAIKGHDHIAKILLNCGANKDSILEKQGYSITPMQLAACHGHEKIVHTLFTYAPQQNPADEKGRIPLWVACLHGRLLVIDYLLLNCGINIEANRELWEHLQIFLGPQPESFAETRMSIQKNMVDSGVEISLQNLAAYEVTGGGSAVTKQNVTRSPSILRLKAALSMLKSNRDTSVDEVIQVLLNEQNNIIATKNYGLLGYKHSEYYQALEKSINIIRKVYRVIKQLIGENILEPHTPTVSLLGKHRDAVSVLAISDIGVLASGSTDKTIKFWDLTTGHCNNTLSAHNHKIQNLVALPRGRFASSGFIEKDIKVWDLHSKKCIQSFKSHYSVDALMCLPGSDEILISSSFEGIFFWKSQGNSSIKNIGRDYYPLAALSQKRFVSGDKQGTIQLWDALNAKLVQEMTGHNEKIEAFLVLSNGHLVSASRDKTIKIWDPIKGICLNTLVGHTNTVTALAALSETVLVSASSDNTIKLWNLLNGRCYTLTGHSGGVNALVVSPNKQLICGCGDGTIKMWSIPPEFSLSNESDIEKSREEARSSQTTDRQTRLVNTSSYIESLRFASSFGRSITDINPSGNVWQDGEKEKDKSDRKDRGPSFS